MANTLRQIQKMVYEIRKHKVMFDSDLAELYGVELKRLNESVKRNTRRFPPEFMFQLTDKEWENLRGCPRSTFWAAFFMSASII